MSHNIYDVPKHIWDSCLFEICERRQWILILIIFTIVHADTSSLPVEQPHTFQINFNSLYTALCEQQRSDQATLLLYTLLHQNTNMRTYVLSRTDMDNLVGRIEVNLNLTFWKQITHLRNKTHHAVLPHTHSVRPWSFIIQDRCRGSVNRRDVCGDCCRFSVWDRASCSL